MLAVLEAYGIATLRSAHASTADDAAAAAHALGLLVVLKIDSPDIVHRTDVGGVMLDIRSEDEVRTAFNVMVTRAREHAPLRWPPRSIPDGTRHARLAAAHSLRQDQTWPD